MIEIDTSQCVFPVEDIWKLERPVAIFLDYMNLKLTLEENGYVFDLQSIVCKIKDMVGQNALFSVYLPSKQLDGKLLQFLSNLGLRVRSVPCKDVDAIMGFELSGSIQIGVKTLVIGSHDGDFSPIVDDAKMRGCRVIFLCDPKSLSSLLKEKVEVIDISDMLNM